MQRRFRAKETEFTGFLLARRIHRSGGTDVLTRTVMDDRSETRTLARKFSDKSRRVMVHRRKAIIPHKVKPDGQIISDDNVDCRVDISQLNLDELRFLDKFRESGWDFDLCCERMGLKASEGTKIYRKCLWFKIEDEIVRAKAKIPSANYILAKDVDNVQKAIQLDDSQHKSLDRMAKITGSFKTAEGVNIQQNVFNLPPMTPDIEAQFKALAERAMEAQIVTEEKRVA